MSTLKVIELFAGIGSPRKALINLGIPHTVVGLSEIDKFAIRSYETLYGQTYTSAMPLNYGNIVKVKQLDYADLWVYGFPCFVEGTLVLTSRGFKPIEEIQIGDEVLTHNNRYQKVVTSMVNQTDCLYKIDTMASESLYTTREHPFYVRRRYRTYPRRYENGQLKRHAVRNFGEPEWIEARRLTKDYYVGIAINNESRLPSWNGTTFSWKDGRNRYIFSNILKEKFIEQEFWWLIGRYIGDGWVKQKGIIICCENSEIEEIASRLETLGFNYCLAREKTVCKVHIQLKELMEYVEQFGRGASNKHLTDDILNLPVKLLQAFLEGYMSADGCYTQGFHKATSVSRVLIYGIGQCVAKVYKRPFSIYRTNRPKTCVIEGRIVNQRDTYTVSYKMTADKQDKAFYENGYIWSPINDVSIISHQCNVYNFEVEEDNSYVVQNIIVHNCQDVSCAGNRKGLDGERSGLLYEVERLLGVAQIHGELPKYLLMENVKNLTGKAHRAGFDKWLDFLYRLGYNNYWQVLNALDFGLPQNRERVFVVSIRNDIDKGNFKFPTGGRNRFIPLKELIETRVDLKYYLRSDIQDKWQKYKDGMQYGDPIIVASRGRNPDNPSDRTPGNYVEQRFEPNPRHISNTLTTVQKDNWLFDPRINIIRNLTPREYWRLMGFTDEDFDKVRRVNSDAQLYKQAANAIAVPVLEGIFKNLFVVQ